MRKFGKNNFIRNVVLSVFMTLSVESAVVISHYSANSGEEKKTITAEQSEKLYVGSVLRKHKTGLSRVEEARLATYIIEQSRKNGLDPMLILALIETESTYYNWAKSNKGALGLMQVVPATGYSLAEELNIKWEGDKTLYDPYKNVKMGVHYYASLLERFEHNNSKALAAYNAGPTYVARRLRGGKNLPRRYRDKVFANYRSHKQSMVF